jgi:protein-tyrosine-phosphatase
VTGKGTAPSRVLFVCTGNTCRSVLAEYLARDRFGNAVIFESAGIRPQPAADAENAIYTLRKNFGIDASKHTPRDVRSVDLRSYSLVIALDTQVMKIVRDLGVLDSKLKVWAVKDPYGPDLTEYDRVSLELKRKIAQFKRAHQTQQT